MERIQATVVGTGNQGLSAGGQLLSPVWPLAPYSPQQSPAPKGYGLQTILMHQFRGLVVWRRQKKATGARSGCGTSGSAPSGGSSKPGGEGGGLRGLGCSVTSGSAAGAAEEEGGRALSAMSALSRELWGERHGMRDKGQVWPTPHSRWGQG